MTPLLLGIDLGTSGAKAMLLDEHGALVASATSAYPISTPRPLWSEQDPDDWWRGVCTAIGLVLESAGADPASIACVGLSGQMHGLVALDAAGEVIRPCILWNDQRTADECAAIEARIGRDTLVRITGKPVLPSFTAPKILWMRRHEPDLAARIAHVLLPKDYIRFRLTGTYFGDVSDASGTSLFDVGARRWSTDLLDALEIPAAWMPEVTESTEVSAYVSVEGARASGLANGTPVVGGAGDQAAEAVGCGVLAGGVSVTIGTSGVVFAGMEEYRPDTAGRVHAYCHAAPGTWHVMGVMLSAGGSLRWFRDEFCEREQTLARMQDRDTYEVMMEEAAKIPAGCESLLFLPYLTGERCPHPDPFARGVFFGLTARHTRAHMLRAVIEGITFGLRDSLELVHALGIHPDTLRISGGGARSALWRQIMADVFGAPVAGVNVAEGAAFGAALLAGTGAGVFASVDEAVRRVVRTGEPVAPGADRSVYERMYARYTALYPALREQFAALPRE